VIPPKEEAEKERKRLKKLRKAKKQGQPYPPKTA